MGVQFKITKDEAAILAAALEEEKFNICHSVGRNRDEAKQIIKVLNVLNERLENFSKDERLHSRHISWNFNERVRKYVKQKDS